MKIEITEKEVLAAFEVAKSDEAKKVLAALFNKSNNVPNMDNYKSIRTYEDACMALGEEPILNETTRMMYNNLENLIGEFPQHIIALMKLETISRALWGKDFQPKPDAEGSTCYYYPWFALYTKKEIEGMTEKDKGALFSAHAGNGAISGFGCLLADVRSSRALANIGFRLCQETEEKAIYFGQQFIELWAEYLAFNFTTGERINNG
jgi:hypothetical protein